MQRSCEVVLAVGRPEVTAAVQTAPRYRKVGFVLVDGAGRGTHAGNVTVTHTGDGLRTEAAGAVEREPDARGQPITDPRRDGARGPSHAEQARGHGRVSQR
ncbi:hypothetical protein ACWCP6_23485 [Streptomyces sp. NPDC002004]